MTFAFRFSRIRQLFSSSCRNSWFEHFPVVVNETTVRLTFTLSASQLHTIKERCRFLQIDVFHQSFPHGFLMVLPSYFDVVHVHGQEKDLVDHAQTDVPRLVLSSHPFSRGTVSNCLFHSKPATECPYKIFSRRTTRSSTLCQVFGHL